jgi:hypothetical protein
MVRIQLVLIDVSTIDVENLWIGAFLVPQSGYLSRFA